MLDGTYRGIVRTYVRTQSTEYCNNDVSIELRISVVLADRSTTALAVGDTRNAPA